MTRCMWFEIAKDRSTSGSFSGFGGGAPFDFMKFLRQ